MSYHKYGNTVSIRCDTKGCTTVTTDTLTTHETSLDGYRRLWSKANGWTATSTDHHCPKHSD